MYHFTINTAEDAAYRRHLQGILRAHNQQTSDVRGPEAVNLYIRVTDRNNHLVGGLIAQTYWEWLVIDVMALEERVRRQGLGTQMLLQAEDEAKSRGCSRSHTSTYLHQGLGFYQHHGYQIVGELADYPDGYTLYWLRKEL